MLKYLDVIPPALLTHIMLVVPSTWDITDVIILDVMKKSVPSVEQCIGQDFDVG